MKKQPADVWVTWEEYHRLIELLAVQVHDSGWQFDHILCLARGGLRIGDVFSRLFKLPLSILSVSSYRGETGRDQEQLLIGPAIASVTGQLKGKMLLIDDLVDTGLSFKEVQGWIATHHPDVTDVKTAVIWAKSGSQVRPDYFVHDVQGSPWIHQPFEAYEDMSIEDIKLNLNLKSKLKSK